MAKIAKESKIDNIRHSLAHLLAAAVLKRFPKAKLGIGPIIENGFYYDFLLPRSLTPDDLKEIEREMKKLVFQKLPFSGKKIMPAEAKKLFKDQQFKLDLIKEFVKEKKSLTAYKTGDVFFDLCKGGHVKNTKEINTDAFKLTHVAGAYWRGDEKNPQLQRVYGLAFENKKELEEYLCRQEEIKKWDHRKLGRELDLFSFHEEGPGFVFWHPKGMLLRETLMKVYNELQKSADYKTVSTPILLSEELWRKSGHWDNYKDKMYFTKIDNKSFAVKPMNCPGVILIYNERPRSWRDLPLRLSEAGEVHRHEPSGTLHGLFRVRAFRQDDAHVFVREDQIEKEVKDRINNAVNELKKAADNFNLILQKVEQDEKMERDQRLMEEKNEFVKEFGSYKSDVIIEGSLGVWENEGKVFLVLLKNDGIQEGVILHKFHALIPKALLYRQVQVICSDSEIKIKLLK